MKYLFILLISLTLIQSCSDTDSVANSDNYNHNYLPFSVGSYWVFNSIKLDYYNNEIANSQTIDSLVIEKEEKTNDGKVFTIVNYINGAKELTYSYKIANYDLYLNGLVKDSTEYYKDKWMLIFDSKLNSIWNIAKIDTISKFLLNDSISDFTLKLNINAYYNFKFKKKLFNDSVNTINFRINRDYLYSKLIVVNTPIKDTEKSDSVRIDSITVQSFKLLKTNYTFAENIGFFSIYEEPYSVNTIHKLAHSPSATILNKYPNREFYGKKSTLIRYRIAK